MSITELDREWTVYTANCGECGGRGGQDCHGDKWADCPYCKPEEDCALCGDVFDTKDTEPKRLLADGRPQPVCSDCWALEPAEVDVA